MTFEKEFCKDCFESKDLLCNDCIEIYEICIKCVENGIECDDECEEKGILEHVFAWIEKNLDFFSNKEDEDDDEEYNKEIKQNEEKCKENDYMDVDEEPNEKYEEANEKYEEANECYMDIDDDYYLLTYEASRSQAVY
jgi:hypothetical protein